MSDAPAFDEVVDEDDLLDACDVDFTEGAITDEDVLKVVFGDDPAKWKAYREWFEAVKRAETNLDR